MKTFTAVLLASLFMAFGLFAQQPTPTPKKDPFEGFGTSLDKRPGQSPAVPQLPGGLKGSALDQPASGRSGEPVNGIEIVKATYGVPGRAVQVVASRLRRILRDANVSADNKLTMVVSEDLAYYKTQTEAVYHGSYSGTYSGGTFTMTKEARPILTVIYRVDGVQKMLVVAQGDTLVMP